ncbi:hypothetical protein VNO78_05701 [Psophocarpus tetragonolobus]|uniref:Uncharacterized protein n=1 Tax=Psophocarpus tetragonolobus TaxID=3891 RepID=A0AAN9SS59_PSOTE
MKELFLDAREVLESFFLTLKPWNRFVWVRLQELPIQAWKSNFFQQLVASTGSFVTEDDSTARQWWYNVTRELITTQDWQPINKLMNGVNSSPSFVKERGVESKVCGVLDLGIVLDKGLLVVATSVGGGIRHNSHCNEIKFGQLLQEIGSFHGVEAGFGGGRGCSCVKKGDVGPHAEGVCLNQSQGRIIEALSILNALLVGIDGNHVGVVLDMCYGGRCLVNCGEVPHAAVVCSNGPHDRRIDEMLRLNEIVNVALNGELDRGCGAVKCSNKDRDLLCLRGNGANKGV